jgi:hypothetical protein
MAQFLEILQGVGAGLGYAVVVVLCLVGLILSCVSLSGTWVVLAGALLAKFLSAGEFPGWAALGVMAAVSVLVEVAEFFAGTWGVTRRGGSGLAGFMALVGGIAGLFLGALIPIPILGSLLGMTIGSFTLVFLVEQRRLRQKGAAAHIAWGAVLARMLMIMLKVAATLGMIAYLALGSPGKA